MPSAYIVEAVRTAVGKKNGTLKDQHPADLGAAVVNELVARTKINPALVDDVIFGCVDQVGSQAGNLGRTVVLSSVLPESVPGTTVDRQCGSSQQAIHFAAQAVMSGTQDIVIAGGVENMSSVPIGASVADGMANGHGYPWNGTGVSKRYPGVVFSQFEGAELLAKKHDVSKEEMDTFGWESHQKADKAIKAGYFKKEIVPVKVTDEKTGSQRDFAVDEGVRASSTLEQVKSLKPLKKEGGRITAGSSSQISDGAAAILIMNEEGLRKTGLKPRAKIISLALAGDDPVVMLGGPIPATQLALKKAGLTIDQIDLYEVNEAFASVPLSWAKALKADRSKLNVNGGACALGHPLGATGAKLMTTLVHELERRGGRYGLQAICEGGGTANATIIERIGAADNKAAAPAASAPAAAAGGDSGLAAEAFFAELKKRISPEHVKKVGCVYRFDITGDNGKKKSWVVNLKSGNGEISVGDENSAADCIIGIGDKDFTQLMGGKLNAMQAFTQGKLKLKGNMMLAQKLQVLMANNAKL